MKINVLSPGFYRSGGLLTIYDYSKHLIECGHEVTLYIPKKIYNLQVGRFQPIEMLRRFVWRIRVDRGKYVNELNKYKFEIKLISSLKDKFIDDADITIATAWPTAYDLYKLNKSKGVKVYFVQDYEIWDSNIEYVNKSYRLPLNRITVSQYLHDLLVDKFDAESEIVLNSINFDIYDNNDKVLNQNPVVLFIYSRAQRKNISMILNAVEKLHGKFPNVIFRAFGFEKDPELPSYIEYYENPTLNAKLNLYRSSDIFLLSSLFEGFGLPPAEAMACKCAVVSTNVGAMPEFSVNKESSLLVEPDDESGFLESIEYLLVNKDELKRFSLSGYSSVREKLNYEKSVKKFEDILRKWYENSKDKRH